MIFCLGKVFVCVSGEFVSRVVIMQSDVRLGSEKRNSFGRNGYLLLQKTKLLKLLKNQSFFKLQVEPGPEFVIVLFNN